MMFASKRATDLPPLVEHDCLYHGPECYGCVFEMEWERTPDTNNPSNPILVAFRDYVVNPYDPGLSWCAGVWLAALEGRYIDVHTEAWKMVRDKIDNTEHVAHARRILDRLAS